MKRLYLTIISLTILGLSASAQTEQCGTMQNLADQIKQNPALKEKMEKIELQMQEWIRNNSRLKFANTLNKEEKTVGSRSMMSLCGYDNSYFTTISAPTFLNQIVNPSPNCTYGGEYVTVTGLVAGNIYRISTCGANNFDTQLSIYTVGGGQAVAHNDDWCGAQSEITFNPLTSGDFDILVDEYNCIDNTTCADLAVELIYTPRPVITIPVVVHVIHFGEAIGTGRNISALQIQSQIDVLNEDYRRFNADINITPPAFRGISDDALVQFCLAQQDEFGDPTTGIDRFNGGMATWTMSDFNTIIKPVTVWDRDLYLNLWTWDGSGAYAQFPGGSANTDGVVVRYDNFGNVGTVVFPFDLGRTATHEIGHWLNLRHIWGDAAGCATDDSIADTPLQDMNTAFGTCPTFPSYTQSCSGTYPGTMFYNQMDYSGDACLTMFTVGQTSRMDATIFGSRISLWSSQGCMPSTVGISQNYLLNNISIFPNPSNGSTTLQTSFNKEQNIAISVYNVLGEKIWETKEENVTNKNIIIDLGNKSEGIYFVHINSNTQSIVKKLVIKKSN